MVQAAGWLSPVPGAPDVENEAARRLEDAMYLLRERPEPLDVGVGINVAVGLLPTQGKGGGGQNQRDRRGGEPRHEP